MAGSGGAALAQVSHVESDRKKRSGLLPLPSYPNPGAPTQGCSGDPGSCRLVLPCSRGPGIVTAKTGGGAEEAQAPHAERLPGTDLSSATEEPRACRGDGCASRGAMAR